MTCPDCDPGDQAALQVLQICHDYEGPFVQVAAQYAAGFVGSTVTTVFLRGAQSENVAAKIGGEVLFLELPDRSLRGLKLRAFRSLNRIMATGTFDIVLAHRYKPLYLAILLGFLHQIRIIGVAHEHGMFRRAMRRFMLARAEVTLLTVSDSVRNDVLACCPKMTGKVHVAPNVINPQLADNLLSREQARASLGLPEDAVIIGTIGRLVAKKNHEFLIDAFAKVVSPGRHLVIIGDGPKKSRLDDMVSQHHLGGQVHLAGHLDEGYKYLRAFDWFVLAADNREAFGIVLLEAMLAGVPIISSSAPGPAEVTGEAALIYEEGNVDALLRVLQAAMSMDQPEKIALSGAASKRLEARFLSANLGEKLKLITNLTPNSRMETFHHD